MIDWNKSAKLNMCSIDDLKVRFERFPKSGKRIIAICDDCGLERDLCFQSYHDLCNSCAQIKYNIDHPEFRESKRLRGIEQFSNQKSRDEMSKIKKQYYIDHPDAVDASSVSWSKYWSIKTNRDDQRNRLLQFNKAHPEAGAAQSERLKNSDAMKIAIANMYGGSDIIDHHIAYDFLRTEELIVKITRHQHGLIHHPPGISIAQRGYSLID